MPQAGSRARTIRLGLIGDNIAQSQAPRLHELAGRLAGIRSATSGWPPGNAAGTSRRSSPRLAMAASAG